MGSPEVFFSFSNPVLYDLLKLDIFLVLGPKTTQERNLAGFTIAESDVFHIWDPLW